MEHLERRSRGCASGGDPCVAAPAVEKRNAATMASVSGLATGRPSASASNLGTGDEVAARRQEAGLREEEARESRDAGDGDRSPDASLCSFPRPLAR